MVTPFYGGELRKLYKGVAVKSQYRGDENMGVKIVFLLLLCVLLFAVPVAAEDTFSVTYKAIKDQIFIDEVAEFEVTITNHALISQKFSMFTIDPLWRVHHEGSVVTLAPKEKKTVRVLLDPTRLVDPANAYTVPLTIRPKDGDQQTIKPVVVIDTTTRKTYNPSVFVDVEVNEENIIVPNEVFDVTVRLLNKNRLMIDPLQVTVEATHFSDDFSTQLLSNDGVTKILSFKVDPQTQPGDGQLDIHLSANGEDLGIVKSFTYRVVASAPGFEREVLTNEQKIFKNTYAVELLNNGNVLSSETIQVELGGIQKYFVTSNQDVVIEDIDGTTYAVFDATLQPGDSLELSVQSNARPFVFWTLAIIILIVVCTVLYYTFRTAVVIQKRVHMLRGVEDSTSRLKVVLHIKNRTGKMLENVKVIERTPNITEVDKEFSLGTLKPSKIVSSNARGSLIRWDFVTLEPYEERIITYHVNSKLSILGDINLPDAIVKYDTFGRTRTVKESSDGVKSDDDFED
ncbi:MAG: hypothetical protein ACI8Y7_000468 [Candidatus Woesearchaeota archaeon]